MARSGHDPAAPRRRSCRGDVHGHRRQQLSRDGRKRARGAVTIQLPRAGPAAARRNHRSARATRPYLTPNQTSSSSIARRSISRSSGDRVSRVQRGVRRTAIVRLRAQSQRRITDEDPDDALDAGDDERRPAATRSGASSSSTPDTILPHGCAGDLVPPSEVDAGGARHRAVAVRDLRRFPPRLAALRGHAVLPDGPLRLNVQHSRCAAREVLRHVHILPETKFAISTRSQNRQLGARGGAQAAHELCRRRRHGDPRRLRPAAARQSGGGIRTTGYAPTIKYPYGRSARRARRLPHARRAAHQRRHARRAIAPVPEYARGARARASGSDGRDTMWNTFLETRATVQRIPMR